MTVIRLDYNTEHQIAPSDVIERATGHIGVDPFAPKDHRIRPIQFSLESVLHKINAFNTREEHLKYDIEKVIVAEVNWNPFVYTKEGKKEYYQRPLVWTLKDKQSLIASIYNNIDCGKLLIRNRSFEELREMHDRGDEMAFADIVDGKQRLDAIISFMKQEFPDLDGNFYGDLSAYAQHHFTDHQLLSYSEISENTPDENVVYQFLRLNFAGVPQSLEHIQFVQSIQKKM